MNGDKPSTTSLPVGCIYCGWSDPDSESQSVIASRSAAMSTPAPPRHAVLTTDVHARSNREWLFVLIPAALSTVVEPSGRAQ